MFVSVVNSMWETWLVTSLLSKRPAGVTPKVDLRGKYILPSKGKYGSPLL